MNRRYRFVFAGIMVAITLYVASYWFIRQSHTTLHIECEGCGADGWEQVKFPGDGVYLVYAPLYQLDKLTDSNSRFHIVRGHGSR